MPDATTEETQKTEETSTEEKSTSETTKTDKEGDGEVIPTSRFKEVYGKWKEAERKLGEAHEIAPDKQISGDDKEAQARAYLKSLSKEALAELQQEQKDVEAKEYAKFKEEVTEVLEIHTDIKKQEFLDFLDKEGDDYSSVTSAMKGFKRLQETAKEASDKTKKSIAAKPGLPKSEGPGGKSADEVREADKGKSLQEIAQEAIREQMKSK